jgi:hypothetical protein
MSNEIVLESALNLDGIQNFCCRMLLSHDDPRCTEHTTRNLPDIRLLQQTSMHLHVILTLLIEYPCYLFRHCLPLGQIDFVPVTMPILSTHKFQECCISTSGLLLHQWPAACSLASHCQPVILMTMDITTNRFSFMLSFGDLT